MLQKYKTWLFGLRQCLVWIHTLPYSAFKAEPENNFQMN